MVKARKYVVKQYFKGLPKKEDFELVEYELPPLKDGEILVKAEWISVDPYLRAFNRFNSLPYDQFSYQVGVVIESKDLGFPVGTRFVTHKGWCDYHIFDLKAKTDPRERNYKLLDMQGLSPSLGVGAIGMPGATAYCGFLNICKPEAGETVVVTGAAGAVGSLVGQIAKIKGCRVIGFAGSDEKVQMLENDLGFHKAFNYKTVDVNKALKEAVPKGVDCFFDNVGGELSTIILSQMNKFGRVAVCGSISGYNERDVPKATSVQYFLVLNELKMEGFNVSRWNHAEQQEAMKQMMAWIKGGQVKAKEHVTEGFDKLYDAFVGMLAGENVGKAIVKV